MQKPIRTLPAMFCALALLLPTAAHAQTTYQWNGTTDGNYSTSGNWAAPGVMPTGSTIFGRLNVFSSPNNMTYGSAQGSTTLSNSAGRGIVVGSGNPGTLNITGGTLSAAGSISADIIGNGANGFTMGAVLNVSGGTYIGSSVATTFGAGAAGGGGNGGMGTINISGSGLVQVSTLIFANLTNSTVNLNGGTLLANNVTNLNPGSSSAWIFTNTFRFNGGTLKARQNDPRFLSFFSSVGSPLIVSTVYVTNGGAFFDSAGFNITVPSALVAEGSSTGGLTKNGAGLLSLGGTNTYIGATTVNQGGLAMILPSSSKNLTLASGTSNNITINGSTWNLATAALTNNLLGFNYGGAGGTPATALVITNLAISGSVTCNIAGSGGLSGNITLISYASGAHPGGTFVLGSLPSGMTATLVDDGTNVILQVGAGSAQNLTWSASVNSNWQTNGAANWNSGAATYFEYISGAADYVTFTDTPGGTVNLVGAVKPGSVTISNNVTALTFSGSGSISGTNSITKLAYGALTISTTNDFTGPFTISSPDNSGNFLNGGSVFITTAKALGNASSVTIKGPAEGDGAGNGLALGSAAGGITVTGISLSLSGGGINNSARGALHAVTNANVWTGPVLITGSVGPRFTRIGTADAAGASIEVTGQISDGGNNLRLILRPGTGGTVKISGTNNSWGFTRTFSTTGTVQLGANNALSTNVLELGPGFLDLNGFNQSFTLFNDDSGVGTVLNNGAQPSTLTINNLIGGSSCAAVLANGSSQLNLVKSGAFRQTLTGANTYTGTTLINGGELRVNGSLGNTAVTVATNGTLSGSGSISSSVTVQAGGTFAPGDGFGLISSMANVNTLNLNAGSTSSFEIDATAVTSDSVTVGTANYDGLLSLTLMNGTPTIGQVFTLFNATSRTGNFTNAALVPIVNSSLAGSFNPTNGQVTIISPVNTNPTNLVFNVSGSTLTLSWPADYLGWTLQSNSVSLLNTNAWFPVAGSAAVTNVVITIDPAQSNVFYRMVYP